MLRHRRSPQPLQIKTGPAERKSLLLPRGGELRVDASSVVTIAEGGEIHISKGALYLDSKGTTLPTVITPAGRITDIGTRFEVRLVAGDTRVRVRDGKVRLAQASAVSEVAAAEELLARADASTTRRRVDPFGAEWAWVARAAPRFELEGKSLGSFLDWIEKEGAWTVAFASPALERARAVHGAARLGRRHVHDRSARGDSSRVRARASGGSEDRPRDRGCGGPVMNTLLAILLVAAQAAPSYAGKPLGDVLRDLQRRGLNVVFSSELVKPDMKVAAEPKATTPRRILDEVLAPHGLAVRGGPRESFVVVRAKRRARGAARAGRGGRAGCGTCHRTIC